MRRAAGIAGVVFLLAAAFALGVAVTQAPDPGGSSGSALTRDPPPRLLDEVRDQLRTGYYRALPAGALEEDTVAEVLAALDDPYTEYLSPTELDSLQNRTARSYSGVGLTVGPAKEGLIVTSALEGPARQAGIRRGDVIVSINGRSMRRVPFERSLALIKGEEGTFVRLTVKRPGARTFPVTVVRQEIAVPALRARLVRDGATKIGYLRLLSFPASAAERLEEEARALRRRGARGFVLDLRDNPGGLLAQAVRTVSLFLDEGVVCSTEGVHHERRVYDVSGNATYPRLPLVVLVNRGSASAAEVVAGAFRDHERAVVVGQRTYGKASVQTVEELSNGGALKLTTAVFLTPAGTNLMTSGLRPTVRAVDDPLTRRDEALAVARRTLLEQIKR